MKQLDETPAWRSVRCIMILLFVALLAAAAPGTDYKIDRDLMKKLADDEEATAPFFVVFGERPDLSLAHRMNDRAARGRLVVQALQATAERSQAGVRGYLQGHKVDFTPYWVENKIYVSGGTLELARALAQRPEVVAILPEDVYTIPDPQPSGDASVQAIGWNILKIRADQVWSAYGTEGAGLVVANIDTGVQYNHPAVVSQYRGNTGSGFSHVGNWKDPTGVCGATPCDNHGHGTHTMGTMVGDDGGSNQIGVAPGAKWIACKGCQSNSCSGSHLIACAQWIMDPYGDGSGQPDVVNNSWGGGSGNSWYRSYVQNWRAAGIFPAFSIGNSGPACETAGSPGDYPESFASGATSNTDVIASFSSRGPSAFGGIIKPDVSAPGVSVRSSVPTDRYSSWSGTSMASPHTAGAAALLWAARPAYLGNIGGTEQLLRDGAVILTTSETCGGVSAGASPNNTYGYGLIDVKAAADAAGGPPNQAPTVTIVIPANGSSYDCGSAVSFAGSANDPEDGDLTPSLTWTDNNAPLGNGGSFTKTYSCTEVGNHNIVARAIDSVGASNTASVTITIVDASVPAAPSNLSAKARGSEVLLNWTDNSSNEEGFYVQRKDRVKKSWTDWEVKITVGENVTSTTDTPPRGQYQYRVVAFNGSSESAPSNVASVKVK